MAAETLFYSPEAKRAALRGMSPKQTLQRARLEYRLAKLDSELKKLSIMEQLNKL